MTRTTRLRRMILHLRQIFFTEANTFIFVSRRDAVLTRATYLARKTIRPLVKS